MYYPEGECPIPVIFENEIELIVIYDVDGNPFVIEKIPLGFDLSA
jgi:hypothetical protein